MVLDEIASKEQDMASMVELHHIVSPFDHKPTHPPTVALIPAYNEERYIGSLVLAARAYVDQVVVVDDGSNDRTAEIARLAGATVVQHRANQGKAAGVNTGFAYLRQIKPRAVVMLDGDGQHCADDIPQVLAPILDGAADVVVGSRFKDVHSEIPAYRQVGQHGLTLITNLASGIHISDSQSGFRAFSAEALEQLFFGQSGFSIESEMQFLVREHKLRVAEVGIKVVYAEKAKRNPVNHGLQVVNGIMRLVGQTRPLLYFGLTGLGLALIGMSLGLYVVDIYSRTAELAVGYALLTVMLCVIGMLLLFSGLILHSTRGMIVELRRSVMSRTEQLAPHAVQVLAQPERPAYEHEQRLRVGERTRRAESLHAR
jgi:glycosyltransferase involved in cell wall biosynthesis